MPTNGDPPQLQISLPGNTTSFKRSFDQFGFDLESPVDPSSVASGSSTQASSSSSTETNGDRNKRARSGSASGTSSSDSAQSFRTANEALVPNLPSTQGQTSNVPETTVTSSSALPIPASTAPALDITLPTRLSEDVFMHDASPTAEQPPASSTSSLPAASSATFREQFRVSMERFNTFESEMSTLRRAPTTAPTRSMTPPPTLPPLSLLVDDDETSASRPTPDRAQIRGHSGLYPRPSETDARHPPAAMDNSILRFRARSQRLQRPPVPNGELNLPPRDSFMEAMRRRLDNSPAFGPLTSADRDAESSSSQPQHRGPNNALQRLEEELLDRQSSYLAASAEARRTRLALQSSLENFEPTSSSSPIDGSRTSSPLPSWARRTQQEPSTFSPRESLIPPYFTNQRSSLIPELTRNDDDDAFEEFFSDGPSQWSRENDTDDTALPEVLRVDRERLRVAERRRDRTAHSATSDLLSGYFHPNSLSASDLDSLTPIFSDPSDGTSLIPEEERPLLSAVDGHGAQNHDVHEPQESSMRAFPPIFEHADDFWTTTSLRHGNESSWMDPYAAPASRTTVSAARNNAPSLPEIERVGLQGQWLEFMSGSSSEATRLRPPSPQPLRMHGLNDRTTDRDMPMPRLLPSSNRPPIQQLGPDLSARRSALLRTISAEINNMDGRSSPHRPLRPSGTRDDFSRDRWERARERLLDRESDRSRPPSFYEFHRIDRTRVRPIERSEDRVWEREREHEHERDMQTDRERPASVTSSNRPPFFEWRNPFHGADRSREGETYLHLPRTYEYPPVTSRMDFFTAHRAIESRVNMDDVPISSQAAAMFASRSPPPVADPLSGNHAAPGPAFTSRLSRMGAPTPAISRPERSETLVLPLPRSPSPFPPSMFLDADSAMPHAEPDRDSEMLRRRARMRSDAELPGTGVFAASPVLRTANVTQPTSTASSSGLLDDFSPRIPTTSTSTQTTGPQASSSRPDARGRDVPSPYSNIDPDAYHDGPLRATLNRIVEIERLRSRISHLESLSDREASASRSQETTSPARPSRPTPMPRPQPPPAPSLPPLRFERDSDRDDWPTVPWRVNQQASRFLSDTRGSTPSSTTRPDSLNLTSQEERRSARNDLFRTDSPHAPPDVPLHPSITRRPLDLPLPTRQRTLLPTSHALGPGSSSALHRHHHHHHQHLPSPTAAESSERSQLHRIFARRPRIEAARIADEAQASSSSNSSGSSTARETIDAAQEGLTRAIALLRSDGLSTERQQQLIERFARERTEERQRSSALDSALWGSIEDDGPSLLDGRFRRRPRPADLSSNVPDTARPSPHADAGVWESYVAGRRRALGPDRPPSRTPEDFTERLERLRAARASSVLGSEGVGSSRRSASMSRYHAATRWEANRPSAAASGVHAERIRDRLPVSYESLERLVGRVGARENRNASLFRRPFRGLGDFMRDEDFDTSYESLLSLAATLGDVQPRCTPDHVISSLPTAPYQQWATSDSDQRCPICLDDYQPEDQCSKLEGCSHWLHKDCLSQWLRGARTCPVCRGTVRDPRQDRIRHQPHLARQDSTPQAGPSTSRRNPRGGGQDEQNDDGDDVGSPDSEYESWRRMFQSP